jgi:hypothetical protein
LNKPTVRTFEPPGKLFLVKPYEYSGVLIMQSTMELFDRAMAIKHAAAWARDLNVTPQTFSMAKKQGRLSPVLAGNFAIELGEDPEHWVAIAALEAEKTGPLLERLRKSQESWRRR